MKDSIERKLGITIEEWVRLTLLENNDSDCLETEEVSELDVLSIEELEYLKEYVENTGIHEKGRQTVQELGVE